MQGGDVRPQAPSLRRREQAEGVRTDTKGMSALRADSSVGARAAPSGHTHLQGRHHVRAVVGHCRFHVLLVSGVGRVSGVTHLRSRMQRARFQDEQLNQAGVRRTQQHAVLSTTWRWACHSCRHCRGNTARPHILPWT